MQIRGGSFCKLTYLFPLILTEIHQMDVQYIFGSFKQGQQMHTIVYNFDMQIFDENSNKKNFFVFHNKIMTRMIYRVAWTLSYFLMNYLFSIRRVFPSPILTANIVRSIVFLILFHINELQLVHLFTLQHTNYIINI